MPLIKKPSMTEKNRAAHQRNARQSRGAATPQGQERSRAAHLRHGFYSQERDEALRALGEDPADLAALIDAAHQEWRPATPFQAGLSEWLARLLWRMQRAERIQESLVAGKVLQRTKHRHDLTVELQKKFNDRTGILRLLKNNASDPRFYTPRYYFQVFCRIFGEPTEDSLGDILDLMHRLRKPPSWAEQSEKATAPPDALGSPSAPNAERPAEGGAEAAADSADDLYLRGLAEMDDEDAPIPWPETPIAEGAERDELREDLGRLAEHEFEMESAAWEPQIAEHQRALSRIEQDEVQAEPHRHAELMRREEERCFRQFVRLGNFLMNFQKHAATRAENAGSSGYIDENTGPEEMEVTAGGVEAVAAGGVEPRQNARSAAHHVPGAEAPPSGNSRPGAATRTARAQAAKSRPNAAPSQPANAGKTQSSAARRNSRAANGGMRAAPRA